MIIKLNNFVINDRESRFYLDTVKGFAIPEIRTSSAVLTERDGGYVASQFYGMRKVSIQGRIFGEDEAELEEKRKEIMAAVRQRSIAIELITNAGNSYLVNGHLTDSEMDFDRLINSSDFRFEFLCPDPVIYDNTDGTALSVQVGKQRGGGYVFPYVLPVSWQPGSGEVTARNNGNTPVKPVIKFKGSMTDPTLINVTTGKLVQLSGFNAPEGSEVVIDTRTRSVLLNGGNIFDKLSDQSTFFSLQPGDNVFRLESASGADTVVATVEWRNGFMGV